MAADGLITISSRYGAKDTADRFDAAIKARGMTVFARIDHAAGPPTLSWCSGLLSSWSSATPKAVHH
jgi:hypothetical protein